MKEIIFWGATGQSIVLHDFISDAGYQLIALFDKNKDLLSPIENVPLYHSDHFTVWLGQQNKKQHFSVAFGGMHGNERLVLHEMLVNSGVIPAILIHPTAFVSPQAIISEGCQILAHSTVMTKARLGKQCIVNTSASIDHECILGHGVHIAPGATLAGCVEVGSNTFIGSGAVVLPRIRIGRNVIVGAGAVVTRDLPDGKVAYGNPARIVR